MIKEIALGNNLFKLAYRTGLWHFKYAYNKKAQPLACGFYLTSKCNFKCSFCNIWRIKPSFQMSEKKARTVIHELSQMGLVYFSISGGEPLLIPYVFDLLAFAKESGIIYTHLVSNAYLLDENRARELAEAEVSEISFSLDGDEEYHDRIRGKKGSFKKVIEAVSNVKNYAPKTKIVLNTILTPENPENAIFAVNMAEKLKVKIKVQPENVHPSFGIKNTLADTKPNMDDEARQKLIQTIDFIKNSSYIINSKPFFENYKAFVFNPEQLIFADDDCIFGYHHVEIFANQVFPCLEGLNWENGFDLSHTSMEKILSTNEYQKKIHQLRKCSYCQRNYYICYYEPRLNFPIWNLIKSRIKSRDGGKCNFVISKHFLKFLLKKLD